MKIIEQVTIGQVQEHLRKQRSGVSLDLASMPGPVSEYAAYRATLDDADVERIFLWFQFGKHTKGGTTKLTDALAEAASAERIRPLIEGDPSRGWGPIDLRTAVGFEPTLLTNDLDRGPLCGMDGNHRMVAQFLMGKGFGGTPVYVCTHPHVLDWAYVTDAARAWFDRRMTDPR